MAAFATAPFRARSRWADDYYAIAEQVGHVCYMVRRLEGPRRGVYVADNLALVRMCRWKTEADKILRQFGPTAHARGFLNPDVARDEKERLIALAYKRRDEFYKRAYVMAREHLTGVSEIPN